MKRKFLTIFFLALAGVALASSFASSQTITLRLNHQTPANLSSPRLAP